MDEVICYVKNEHLNFKVPYTLDGEQHNYLPDYIVRVGDGRPDPLNLLVEVSGQDLDSKAVKVATARERWVPAVNNHGGFGRWAFVEVKDPWHAKTTIREFLRERQAQASP